MNDELTQMIPDPWKSLVHFLTIPVSWIPDMQRALMDFVLASSTGWLSGIYYLLLLFPVLLWIGAVWCTHLTLYTLPFRSGRIELLRMLLLAWWDTAFAIWMYWVGLGRFIIVVAGWLFTLGRLGLNLAAEAMKQLVVLPFKMTGQMTQSYFQPGVPWIAFLLLIFWCVLEATIFTYTLMPTVTEVLAGITGSDASVMTGTILYVFLLLLIMGSFACIQVLADSVKNREYKYLVQMILVEVFVMTFEVMFLYRELVDALSPWIAQQTGEQFRTGNRVHALARHVRMDGRSRDDLVPVRPIRHASPPVVHLAAADASGGYRDRHGACCSGTAALVEGADGGLQARGRLAARESRRIDGVPHAPGAPRGGGPAELRHDSGHR